MSTTTEGQGPARPGETELFVRKASGFVRDVGFRESVGLAAGILCPMYVFISLAAGLTLYPNADYTGSIFVMVAMWVAVILGYRALVVAVPRAGGEYVYASRLLSPGIGAMVGLGMAIFYIWQLAFGARQVAAPGLSVFLAAVSDAVHSGSIGGAANGVSTPTGLLITSLVVIGVCGTLSLLSLRSMGQVLLWIVVLQLVGLVIADVMLLHSHADFVASFDRVSGPHAYAHLISAAQQSGGIPVTTFAGIAGAVPYLYAGFNGVQFAYYAGGELKRPSRTYLAATFAVLGVSAAFYVVTWLLLQHAAGLEFMRAQALVSGANPGEYARITSVSPTAGGLAYAIFLAGDPFTKIAMGVSFLIGLLGIPLVFFTINTRILFALAFDGLLPKQLAHVDQRRHVPLIASAVVLIGAAGFALMLAYTSITQSLTTAILVAAAIIVVAMVSAALLPFRRNDLLQDDVRWLGVPRLTVIGGLGAAVLTVVIVVVVANPAQYGQFSTQSVVMLAILVLAGPLLYLYNRTFGRRGRTIDVAATMRELPPE